MSLDLFVYAAAAGGGQRGLHPNRLHQPMLAQRIHSLTLFPREPFAIAHWPTSVPTNLGYSDLHRDRLEFLQAMLAPFGAHWSGLEPRVSTELNQGEAHSCGGLMSVRHRTDPCALRP
jgi:hypothetical protein